MTTMFSRNRRKVAGLSSVVLFSAFPVVARADAAATDLSALTGTVNFATVSTAVVAIAGSLAAVYVTMRGAKLVLSMIRGR